MEDQNVARDSWKRKENFDDYKKNEKFEYVYRKYNFTDSKLAKKIKFMGKITPIKPVL